MNKSCEKKTQQHIVKIFYMWLNILTNIKRKKYKTVCAELLFTSHFQQNGHDFFMEFVIFAWFAMQLDYCNIQRVHDQM